MVKKIYNLPKRSLSSSLVFLAFEICKSIVSLEKMVDLNKLLALLLCAFILASLESSRFCKTRYYLNLALKS